MKDDILETVYTLFKIVGHVIFEVEVKNESKEPPRNYNNRKLGVCEET